MERTARGIFFSASTYFVHFLALGFGSFPLQTHLRKALTPSTASMVAGLVPIAACTTYFLFRFAESKGWTRHPQRLLLLAGIGVALMQWILGMRLRGIAEGSVFLGPAIDVAICLLLLGCVQSSVMTLLNHIGVATMGSLAYTVRASGSAGYMAALMMMGSVPSDWLDLERHHLAIGACVSILHCLLALSAIWMLPETQSNGVIPSSSRSSPKGSGALGNWEWNGLLVLVWLVAVCEMSYGLYAHEFLTTTFGGLGYFVFASAVAIELGLLITMPLFPKLKQRLLFVGPMGWIALFSGCILSMQGFPILGWCGLALALNCPFQVSANEHAHRLRPTVMGIASMTLAQSLGYVTAAGLSSVAAKWVVLYPDGQSMPSTLWMLVLPLACLALVLAIRKLARQDASLDIDNLGQTGSMPRSGAVSGIQKGLDDLEGNLGADNPRTDTENVHVVVLDPLPGRVGVVTQTGSNPRELVGSDTHPHPRATDQNPSIDFAGDQPGSNRFSKIREIA